MKISHLKKLEEIYGGKEGAAKAIGISTRQFYRYLAGKKASGAVEKMVQILLAPYRVK